MNITIGIGRMRSTSTGTIQSNVVAVEKAIHKVEARSKFRGRTTRTLNYELIKCIGVRHRIESFGHGIGTSELNLQSTFAQKNPIPSIKKLKT